MRDDFDLYHQRRARRPLSDVTQENRARANSKATGERVHNPHAIHKHSLHQNIRKHPHPIRPQSTTKTTEVSSLARPQHIQPQRQSQKLPPQKYRRQLVAQQNSRDLYHMASRARTGAAAFELTDYSPTVAASNGAVRAFSARLRLASITSRARPASDEGARASSSIVVGSCSRLGEHLTAIKTGETSIILMNAAQISVTPGDRLVLGPATIYNLGGHETAVYALWEVERKSKFHDAGPESFV